MSVFGTLESVPLLPDLLIGSSIGAFFVGLIAYRHDRRGGRLPRDWIVTRWSGFGAAIGFGIGVAVEVL